jgi:hypothetical protein
MSAGLMPSMHAVAERHWRSTAQLRCAVVGVACERFRLANGRWPDALTQLVPVYLPAVPLDPYGGRPVQYAKSAEGAVVFSSGRLPPDLFGSDAPAAAGFPNGVQIGFRLWNADRRRLPPPDQPQPGREGPP